jgi:acetyl esterase/lipase
MNVRSLLLTAAALILTLPAAAQEQVPGTEYTYKSPNGRPLHLWVSQPEDQSAKHPVIVFFHGGGWTGGNVTQFNKQTKALAERGMVVVNVQYRLVAKAPSNESVQVCLEDAKSAMRWVRSHAAELKIDTSKIVASGGSAGGYLAAAVALVPGWDDPQDDLKISPRPTALALFFPVVDVGPEGYNGKRFGDDPLKFAPVTYLSKDAPPTIIEAGDADVLVKPVTLKKYKAKCDAVGAKCILDFYPDQPHGFANKQPWNSITLNAVIHFLIGLDYLPKSTTDVPVPTN